MRFYLQVLGCPKNQVDAEMMAELLEQAGHRQVPSPHRADVLVVNTCAFIADARRESYRELRQLARRLRPGQRLVVAGCLAQRYSAEVRQQVPEVSALIGTRSWTQVAALFALLEEGGDAADVVQEAGRLVASVRRRASGPSMYVKIADGCDAACTFCAIPLIKGRQQSKRREDVLREARELAAQGARELVLIAQNSTAYGREQGLNDALPPLLRDLAAAVPEVPWLRIMYAHPQQVSEALLEVMAHTPQVCRYLDLPLQHGHPEVLRRMGRPHAPEQVLAAVERIRAALPDVALRSTFIVGFPGETEAQFEALLAFIEAISFDHVGVFGYSREEGTPAARLPGHLPQELIEERRERALLVQQAISLEHNRRQVGRVLDVLVEGVGDGLSVGRTYRQAPEVDGLVLLPGEVEVGAMVPARMATAQEYDLVAEMVAQGA